MYVALSLFSVARPGLKLHGFLNSQPSFFRLISVHLQGRGHSRLAFVGYPQKCPQSDWLTEDLSGRSWTLNRRGSRAFPALRAIFRTPVDVGRKSMELGRLATEKARQIPNYKSFFNLLCRQAPTMALQNVGCCRTLLDDSTFAFTRTRLRTAIYYEAGMCRLCLTITRPHIPIHLVQCKLYGIIPYSLLVGAFTMTATARLDLRLSTKDRERIDRAAALAGLPLAAFVRSAVLREADRTVAAESVATPFDHLLSQSDF